MASLVDPPPRESERPGSPDLGLWQISSRVGTMSAEQKHWGYSEHIYGVSVARTSWHYTRSSGIQCPMSPSCWRERLNLGTHTPGGSHESEYLNE